MSLRGEPCSSEGAVLEPAVAISERLSEPARPRVKVSASALSKDVEVVVVAPSIAEKVGEYPAIDDATVGVGTSEPRVDMLDIAPTGVCGTE